MDDTARDGLLQRVIDVFSLDHTVGELKERKRAAGMRLTGLATPWKTDFSSVARFTHELTDADGEPRTGPDGAALKPISRDYFTKKDRGAVCVLLYDPKADAIVMIQEPRIIGLLFGAGGLMNEFPTGGISRTDKAPADAARREAKEESGLTPKRLIAVQTGSLPSAGRVDERMSLFVAEIDSSKIAKDIDVVRGARGEDEHIRARLVSPAELFKLSRVPEARLNLATWGLAIWFEREHKRIRADWGSDYKVGTKFVHSPPPGIAFGPRPLTAQGKFVNNL